MKVHENGDIETRVEVSREGVPDREIRALADAFAQRGVGLQGMIIANQNGWSVLTTERQEQALLRHKEVAQDLARLYRNEADRIEAMLQDGKTNVDAKVGTLNVNLSEIFPQGKAN